MRLASYLDSEQSKKAAGFIVRKGRVLGCVLYLVGVVFMLLLLPNDKFNRKNFIDENALMAGLVRREFSDIGAMARYASQLRTVVSDESAFMEVVEGELAALGLEVYSQNFSATKLVSTDSKGAVVEGRNVYGILRAGRAQSTESIVLSAPYLLEDADNAHGVAILLSLTKYFQAKNYWAKDLIFLVTSHGGVGVQAWVNQYLGLPSATRGEFGIASSNLQGRSGAIQAAINLEIPSSGIQHVNIIIEGVNGLLPNLDLVNVVTYLCHTEKIKSGFHSRWEWLGRSQLMNPEHQHAMYTTVAMASHQAPGMPLGGHAHFLQHRIDSLTVRGVESLGGITTAAISKDLVGVARVLEGTFRSINNLLETLHHSEFFYFTAANWRFISIGQYMPVLGLLLAPPILEGLSQWVQARVPGTVLTGQFPWGTVMWLTLYSYGSGVVVYSLPFLTAHVWYPMDTSHLLMCLLAPLAVCVLAPLCCRSAIPPQSWHKAKAMTLIFFLLTLIALGIINFSLSVVVSAVLTPPIILARPFLPNRGQQVFQAPHLLLSLALCPPLILPLISALYLYFLLPASLPLSSLVMEGAGLSVRGVATALNAWQLHGCWLFPMLCVGVWPLWLMSWTLDTRREEANKPHSD